MDAHVLADMVRTGADQLGTAASDRLLTMKIDVLARTHRALIWERARVVHRLRDQLLEYFPAALETFEDLDAPETLELLGKAPDPHPAYAATARALIAVIITLSEQIRVLQGQVGDHFWPATPTLRSACPG